MIDFSFLDWFAFAWFLLCWICYTAYVKTKAKQVDCIASILYQHRVEWIRNMLCRDNRITDMALLNNLARMVNFFASTTIFVLAGILAALHSIEDLVSLLSNYDLSTAPTKESLQFKLLILLCIFVFAFFRFTWSMRQHSFCSIQFGAAPYIEDIKETENMEHLITLIAKVSDRAGHEFNYGLRAYYFALAFLTWFINPWLFMVTCTFVVMILHRREFKSDTLQILIDSRKSLAKIKKSSGT